MYVICISVCVRVILNLSTDNDDTIVPSLPKIPSYDTTGMIHQYIFEITEKLLLFLCLVS